MTRTKDRTLTSLEFNPIFSGVMNVVMLTGLLGFVFNGGFKQKPPFQKWIMLGGTIWLLNAVFTICVSSAALRFQAFPLCCPGTSTLYSTAFLSSWAWSLPSSKGGKKG